MEPKILLSFSLYGGGKIDFGYAVYNGGMRVGTAPLMGRISTSSGLYPDIWFKISREYGLTKLKTIFKEEQQNFIPDWLRADCYEGAYYELKNKK